MNNQVFILGIIQLHPNILGIALGMNTQNCWMQLYVSMDNILHNLHNYTTTIFGYWVFLWVSKPENVGFWVWVEFWVATPKL
jgi:hypothetical protein